MKWISFLILFFCFSLSFGQKVTISGYLSDVSNGEKLIGANIYDKESLKGTTSNTYGFFSFTSDKKEITLVFSYVGYQTIEFPLSVKKDTLLNLELSSSVLLKEFEVSAENSEKIQERTQMSTIQIPMKQIETLPAFMGERDVIKVIQLLAGVQVGSEGTTGLFVRGGGNDQNIILLDGVPVYNISHLFGFFSIVNSEAVNSVELTKGGFPARYNGRLSSVIDIRMKEGNAKKLGGSASIGLISSKFTLEGPIIKDKASFIFCARRTYIDVLARPLIKKYSGENTVGGYYFYDINGKINYKFNDRSRVYFSSYTGSDKAYLKTTDEYEYDIYKYHSESNSQLKWGNFLNILRWNYMITPKLFANVTGTYSRYQSLIGQSSESIYKEKGKKDVEETYSYEYITGIVDWGGKIDFDYLPSPNHFVRFGINETYHTFTPGVNTVKYDSQYLKSDTVYGAEPMYSHEFSAYIEDDFKLGSRLKLNPGINISSYFVKDTSYFNPQPRFSANFMLTEFLSIKASYARMNQYVHLLANNTIGLPTDLWVPVTDTIPPPSSDQIAFGLAYNLLDDYEFSIESYYKKMKNLIEYKDGASFFQTTEADWQRKVEIGEGLAYGLEFFLQRKTGKLTGWIGYTISKTTREFENLNYGKSFAFKYDRRHDFKTAISYDFTDRINFGIIWVYGTGNAVTLPVSTYRAFVPGGSNYYYYNGSDEINNYESRNGFREPAYHRLDLSVNFEKKLKYYTRTWTIAVYNAYNRKNPFMLQIEYNQYGEKKLMQYSLFPVLPSFSYNITF